MPQSLSCLLVHVVFSTKDRHPWLDADIRRELFPYLATVVRNSGCECYRVGGVADHVHLAIRLTRTEAIADVVKLVKSSSSQWLKVKVPGFAWQGGYGAFSLSIADLENLQSYIDNQEVHHQKFSFKEEFEEILREHKVEFDPRYVWE